MSNEFVEEIRYKNLWLGTILRFEFEMESGIRFITGDEATQQIGVMNRDKDYVIKPHRHQEVPRVISYTTEVLYIKSGKVRVDFFDNEAIYIYSVIVRGGDLVLLTEGGHGFKFLEKSTIVEVKQGPYVGERDKVRFEPIAEDQVQWRE